MREISYNAPVYLIIIIKMTTATLTKNISLKRKIDIIFNYLLEHKESLFRNTLNEDEQKEIQQRKKGKFENFDRVRKDLLGK